MVGPSSLRQSNALLALALLVCRQPNIGSRVNREVHARFWEHAEVKFLRVTRQKRKSPSCSLRCAQVSSTNRSVVGEAPILTARLQGAFEDELEVALRSVCRRAICTMSIAATSTNAT